jgi:hypothetical protein
MKVLAMPLEVMIAFGVLMLPYLTCHCENKRHPH